jgi:hypothetical protein
MKKNPLLFVLALGLLGLSSCVTTTYMVTDNPVGNKTGVAKLSLFGKDKDISLETAAKNGKITKISTVEVKTTYVLIFPFVKTVVTGE